MFKKQISDKFFIRSNLLLYLRVLVSYIALPKMNKYVLGTYMLLEQWHRWCSQQCLDRKKLRHSAKDGNCKLEMY